MLLPDKFVLEMKHLWQFDNPPGRWDDFLSVHDQPSASGLRANTLKITPEDFINRHKDWHLSPVPWAVSGFYLDGEIAPGREPEYLAGLYYIQEPSAMLPAEVLNVQPGDTVLDLCAAPGGKSTRLAERIGENGLLWANEISSERVKALLKNLELMGIDRSIISNETPERLAAQLPAFFDKILVDAPCSGSGMFRRDPYAINSWEKYGPASCVVIQKDILKAADHLLKPGGHLVYSTCSFSISEDEQMIADFLEEHTQYRLIPYDRPESVSDGLALTANMTATGRIWPHLTRGDGHFCALLEKIGNSEQPPNLGVTESTQAQSDLRFDSYLKWLHSALSDAGREKLKQREAWAHYRLHQDHLHLLPNNLEGLPSLRYVKTGLYLGSFRSLKNNVWRFEPGHALILSMQAQDFNYKFSLERDDPMLKKYLRGETLEWPEDTWPEQGWPENAWVAVCLEAYPLGWARTQGPGQLKNLYPAGWRRQN